MIWYNVNISLRKRYETEIISTIDGKYGTLMNVSKRWKTEWNEHISVFLKLILFALIIGITVGVVGAGFHHAIEIATALRIQYPWLLYLMPVAGVCIIGLYRICGIEKDRGTNFVLTAVREDEPMYLRKAPLIFISTVLTHLVGGSSGREGAALQLGGAISGKIGQAMRLGDKDKKLITMCGMAAGFSALFGTPITAAIFAMEVISVGVMYYAAIVPCVLGAIIAALTAQFLHGEATFFVLDNIPEVTVGTVSRVILLGILCSTISILFCYINHKTPKIYGKYLPNPMVRAAVGGCIVIGLTLVLGTRDYNGAGMDVITRALQGEAVPYAFALKILFTAVTLGAGFKGGEIVPVFFTGATFGCVVGELLGLPAGFAASLGMTAVFCGVTNCPVSSILLAFELFGGESLALYALCIAVAYMLSGYYSLYTEQKILYSKLKPEFINQKAHH